MAGTEKSQADAVQRASKRRGYSRASLAKCSLQVKRAVDLHLSKDGRVEFCAECHPLLIPSTRKDHRCSCNLYDYFVGKRWLCLPCFFGEEAKAYASRSKILREYDANQKYYKTVSAPYERRLHIFESLMAISQISVLVGNQL